LCDRNGTLGDDGRSAPIVSANTASKHAATGGSASSDHASTGDANPTTEQPQQG